VGNSLGFAWGLHACATLLFVAQFIALAVTQAQCGYCRQDDSPFREHHRHDDYEWYGHCTPVYYPYGLGTAAAAVGALAVLLLLPAVASAAAAAEAKRARCAATRAVQYFLPMMPPAQHAHMVMMSGGATPAMGAEMTQVVYVQAPQQPSGAQRGGEGCGSCK
jgi:hypothetical protein